MPHLLLLLLCDLSLLIGKNNSSSYGFWKSLRYMQSVLSAEMDPQHYALCVRDINLGLVVT